MGRFRLYSTDVPATTDPDSLSPAPATLIAFDRDPAKDGSFALQEPDGRGKVIETGDLGVVIHDMGVPTAGGIITIETGVSQGEHLETATAAAFKAAWEAADTEYYLTDGYRVWRVVWQRRPRGCNLYLNQRWIRRGRFEYSYKFIFVVKATEIDLI